MTTVTVLWFAYLAEQRGMAEETISTAATTVADLWQELTVRHAITTPRRVVQPAVDAALVPWSTALADGAAVAFLPPVSGG